jgi:hypothetical protein
MPQQFTTTSHRMGPLSVFTAVTRLPSRSNPWTSVFSRTRHPRFRAPLARAMVIPEGSASPSVGMKAPPITSSTTIRGNSFRASSGDTMCISRPKVLAVEAAFLSSNMRSRVQARCRQPLGFQPVESPVSSSRRP